MGQGGEEGKRYRDAFKENGKRGRMDRGGGEGGKREGTFTPLVIAELSSLPSQYNYLYNTKM